MGTKGTRSSGTQYNPKGATQGNTLVDPKTGLPVDVKTDALGVRRLAVDANVTANISGVEVALDGVGPDGDNVSIVDNVTGNKLKVHADGSIDTNVEVDAADGDNIGLKVQERNNAPNDTQYNKRVTAITGDSDTDTTSMDVSLHDHQGNKFTERNPFHITGQFEKFYQIIGDSSWMALACYDEVIPTYSDGDTTLTLAYMEKDVLIGEAIINYNSINDWHVTLFKYVNDDDGELLLDDDGSRLLLN